MFMVVVLENKTVNVEIGRTSKVFNFLLFEQSKVPFSKFGKLEQTMNLQVVHARVFLEHGSLVIYVCILELRQALDCLTNM